MRFKRIENLIKRINLELKELKNNIDELKEIGGMNLKYHKIAFECNFEVEEFNSYCSSQYEFFKNFIEENGNGVEINHHSRGSQIGFSSHDISIHTYNGLFIIYFELELCEESKEYINDIFIEEHELMMIDDDNLYTKQTKLETYNNCKECLYEELLGKQKSIKNLKIVTDYLLNNMRNQVLDFNDWQKINKEEELIKL